MEKYRETILDSSGNIVTSVNIDVYDTGTTNHVSIFSDDGVTPLSNPFTTGSDGVARFYAADGRYDVKVTKTGFVGLTISDQQLFDRNITGATGGIDNTDSTTVGADSDSNGVGDINFKIKGSTKGQVKNNGDYAYNTNDLFIDVSENRVGIGTATPAETFDVEGTAQSNVVKTDSLVEKTASNGVTAETQDKGDNSTKIATTGYVDSSLNNGNLLINSGMGIAQRGTVFDSTTTPANDDDEYLLDLWKLLSDGDNVVDVTKESGGGVSGNDDYVRFDIETISKKFGWLQIIEGDNCKSIIGDKASLSFDARVSDNTRLSDIRAIVVSWDSTKDTVTSDIISAWAAEGANPTLAANWTAENVAVNLNITTSWARYTINNIDIDTASTKNVAVFFYQNNVASNDTAGDLFELTNTKLEEGAGATPYVPPLSGPELISCYWHFERQIPGVGNVAVGSGQYITGTRAQYYFKYSRKRTNPNISLSSVGDFEMTRLGTVETVSSLVAAIEGLDSANVDTSHAGTSTTIGFSTLLKTKDASSYIDIDAGL